MRTEPVVLPEPVHQRLLASRILPLTTASAVTQEQPVTVFVAGPPGAGKTTLADLIHAVLQRRGGAVRIGRDTYKGEHQDYARLLEEDVRTAGVKVRPDTTAWQAAVEERVRAHRFDAVVETALADPEELRCAAAQNRQAAVPRRLEVLALSTSEAECQLAALVRFLHEAQQGGGRYVSWQNLGTCASGLLHTLAVIEAERLVDRITIVRRDGAVLYRNELRGDEWLGPTGAETAVAVDRSRPWSARETIVFRNGLAQAGQLLHSEAVPADKKLAVQRDSDRAAALAEPLRRIAQPLTVPPGVAYHRLSADEHQWVFDELIVPGYLSRTQKREDPRAVYVMGQPGASKSTAAQMLRRAMRPGTAHLVGDRFKAQHPDYLRLLEENPRGAGAAIRRDYRDWFRQAEAYVRNVPGDALIETAPGRAADFFDSADNFHQDGYPIDLVAVATREADSRLATLLRYARALKAGIPARLTTRTGHNTCFDAVTDIVAQAAGHRAVTTMTVLRRDGQALLREENFAARARAPWAVQAERIRPYTADEAHRFLALWHGLRQALPQHREELEDIAALARPLMPAQMQPSRLVRPHPSPWPLPLPRAFVYEFCNSLSSAA